MLTTRSTIQPLDQIFSGFRVPAFRAAFGKAVDRAGIHAEAAFESLDSESKPESNSGSFPMQMTRDTASQALWTARGLIDSLLRAVRHPHRSIPKELRPFFEDDGFVEPIEGVEVEEEVSSLCASLLHGNLDVLGSIVVGYLDRNSGCLNSIVDVSDGAFPSHGGQGDTPPSRSKNNLRCLLDGAITILSLLIEGVTLNPRSPNLEFLSDRTLLDSLGKSLFLGPFSDTSTTPDEATDDSLLSSTDATLSLLCNLINLDGIITNLGLAHSGSIIEAPFANLSLLSPLIDHLAENPARYPLELQEKAEELPDLFAFVQGFFEGWLGGSEGDGVMDEVQQEMHRLAIE